MGKVCTYIKWICAILDTQYEKGRQKKHERKILIFNVRST